MQMFPPEGITVFGNLLHTHLAGKQLMVKWILKYWFTCRI